MHFGLLHQLRNLTLGDFTCSTFSSSVDLFERGFVEGYSVSCSFARFGCNLLQSIVRCCFGAQRLSIGLDECLTDRVIALIKHLQRKLIDLRAKIQSTLDFLEVSYFFGNVNDLPDTVTADPPCKSYEHLVAEDLRGALRSYLTAVILEFLDFLLRLGGCRHPQSL